MATVCLRCGDFPSGERLLAEKVSLCRECFELKTVDEGIWAFAAPPAVRRRRRIQLLAGIIPGAVLGAWIGGTPLGSRFATPPTGSALDTLLGAALGALAGEVLVLLLVQLLCLFYAPRAEWKAHLMKRLGFEGVDPARFALVSMKIAGKRVERGILLVDEGGLAVLGNRGSRIVVPFREIGFAKTVTPRFFPWLVYAALRPRGGSMLVLRSIEGPTAAANRAATHELAQRIAAGVAT